MGLFDQTYGAKAYTPATLAGEVGMGLADIAGSAFGMKHEEDLVLDVMKNVDPDDLTSVINGYKDILAINPDAAVEYKAQMMPFVEARQQQIRVDTAKAKTATPKQSTFMANVEYNKPFVKQQHPDWTELQVETEARRLAKDKGADVVGQEEGKIFHQESKEVYEGLKGLNEKMNTLNTILDLNEKVTSGLAIGEVAKQANRLFEVFGYNVDEAADAQQFDALTTHVLNEQMTQAKGAQTDTDEARYRETLQSIAGTKEGNRRIIEYLQGQVSRAKEEAKERARFTRQNKLNKTPEKNTQSDWLIHLDKWRKDNNIDFSEQTKELESEQSKSKVTKTKLTTPSVNLTYEQYKKQKKAEIEKDTSPDIELQTLITPEITEKTGITQERLDALQAQGFVPDYSATEKFEIPKKQQSVLEKIQGQPPLRAFKPKTPIELISDYLSPSSQSDQQTDVLLQRMLSNPKPTLQIPQGLPLSQSGFQSGLLQPQSALDAIKQATLPQLNPQSLVATGLLGQKVVDPIMDNLFPHAQTAGKNIASLQRELNNIRKPKPTLKPTPAEPRVGGEEISSIKKVKTFRLTPAEKKAWYEFVSTVPVDENGQRPKGWSLPFKKLICKNRPECKL